MENNSSYTSVTPTNNTDPVLETPQSNINKFLILIIVLLVLLLGAVVFLLFFLMNGKGEISDTNGKLPKAFETLTQPVPEARKEKNTEHEWVYIKEGNIYIYSSAGEQQITTDGSKLITYQDPKWINKKTGISYVKCKRESDDGTKQYYCSIIKKTLSGSEETVIQRTSKPNSNGTQIGAEFNNFQWNHKGDKIVYSAETITSTADRDFGTREFRIYDTVKKTDAVLAPFKLIGGRGGMLDDDGSFIFSDDDSKVILTDTGLYPGSEMDRGTLFVFDTASQKLLYEKSKTLSTFANWIDSNTIVLKQRAMESSESKGDLVKIDLGTDTSTKIADADGFFYKKLNDNALIFLTMNPKSGEGVVLNKLNLDTKTVSKLKGNLQPLKVLNDTKIAVRIMKRCNSAPDATENICGMDIFNGYIGAGYGIYDLTNGDVVDLPISSTDIYYIDVL